MNKIKFTISITTLLLALALVFNCSSTDKKTVQKDFQSTGWLNETIFQVKGKGKPYSKTKETGFLRLRGQSEEVALADAKVNVYKKLLKESYDKNNIPENIKNIVESGRIVKKKWFDAITCEITYRIEDRELKKILSKK